MTSADEDELTHREELAAVLQRRRRTLEILRARLGDLVPAAIVLELEDTEAPWQVGSHATVVMASLARR
jgi:hypothetical protein